MSSKSTPKTRSATVYPILGQPTELPIAQLPTVADVLFYNEDANLMQYHENRHYVKDLVVANIVAKDVMNLWNISPIPTLSQPRVVPKVLSQSVQKFA